MVINDTKAVVLENLEILPRVFRMTFASGQIASQAAPGQFVNLICGKSSDPLLRRPFSVNYVEDDKITLLYQVKGSGTQLLSNVMPGQAVDLIGPLGKGFAIAADSSRLLIIAGGMGVAPMLFLASEANKLGHDITVLFGCQSSLFVPMIEPFNDLCKVRIFTDDGSAGTKGSVAAAVVDYSFYDKIYSCGPEPMLKQVAGIAAENKKDCEISMERHMACGIGACLGCVCRVKTETENLDKYSRVCADGPVYDSKVVRW